MTLNAVLIGVILSDFELGHSRRWLYTKQPQEDCTEGIKRSISHTTFVMFLVKKPWLHTSSQYTRFYNGLMLSKESTKSTIATRMHVWRLLSSIRKGRHG